MTGIIKKIVADRGFGFIRQAGDRDVFFHVQDLDDNLSFDESLVERRVSFSIIDTDKGPRAVNIRASS